MANQLTRQQMINEINAIASEYIGGCDGIWGIKSLKQPELERILNSYRIMIAHERNYRRAVQGTTSQERSALDLMNNPPKWYQDAWHEKSAATAIWRKGR